MPTATASSKLLEPILQLARHYTALPESGTPDADIPTQTQTGIPTQTQNASPSPGSLQQQLMDDVGLNQDDFTRPDTRFPADKFSQVLSRLAKASSNPYISLRLAEATQPRMLGSTGFLISTADTLGDALEVLEEYLPILFESATLRLTQDKQFTRLTLDIEDETRNVAEFFLACLLNWPRWLTGQQIPVQQVDLAYPEPPSGHRYHQLFAAEVNFEAGNNSILLANQYLSLPCTDANREMHQLHREFADALLGASHKKLALTAQIRHLIREQILSQGDVIRREEVARQLGLSLRTLQRKLGELNTNFQTLYDQTRKELCLQMIRKGELSFGEIAFQLGFSNQSAFQKAFKRWAGMPPSRYRQQLNDQRHSTATSPEGWSVEPDPALVPSPPFSPASLEASLLPGEDTAQLHANVTASNICNLLPEKLQKLNPFGLKHLRRAAIFGETFSLNHLAAISSDPEARLIIHLWPAQQEGLIEPVSEQEEALEFRFSQPAIREQLLQNIPTAEQQELHRKFGQFLAKALIKTLPIPETSRQEDINEDIGLTSDAQQQLTETLYHLNRIRPIPETEAAELNPQFIARLNQIAARNILKQTDTHHALYYITQAGQHLSQCLPKPGGAALPSKQKMTPPRTHQILAELLAQQALLCLKINNLKTALLAADQAILLHETKTEIAEPQSYDLFLLKAQILQRLGQPQEALDLLLAHLQPEIPQGDQDRLLYLLQTLERIQALRKVPPKKKAPPKKTEHSVADTIGKLSLLESVSQLARQRSEPLLAACALSSMTEHCLRFPQLVSSTSQEPSDNRRNPDIDTLRALARYAFVGYAWVASWFCGDYTLCTEILQQGLNLEAAHKPPNPHSPTSITAHQTRYRATSEATDLWYCSQIQHWLEPVSQVMHTLRKLGDSVRRKGDPLLSHEQRLTWYQLNTLNGESSLNRIRQRCLQDIQSLPSLNPAFAQTLRTAGTLLADYLQDKALLPAVPEYHHPLQAANLIRAALLLNKQQIWPQLYHWQAQLEKDLPGHLMISETLFCLGLMRLMQSQQEQQLSPRRLRIIEQTESRFELWSSHCPENFSGQYLLLQAEKNRLTGKSPEDCVPLYEQAIQAFSDSKMQCHRAIAFERYADLLSETGQRVLAEFCLNKARQLFQRWGASSKVKQIEQQKVKIISD
ncbi:AraC family transcriptional regulator ligand-binding domain-containing protein [Oceanospirillum sp.]|uniref:AraC family transcriptional regulator n=1 Tax=Oceanospirillum sp. TaxID=2021254 RepID=UPI003A9480F2